MNAYHDGTEDDFTFSYSRDNLVYTPMVTVTATTDNDVKQAYLFPEDVSGTIYVRVQDTDSTQGNRQLDSLFVDYLVITTTMGGGSVAAPVVTITAPSDGSTFTQGATVSFAGTASDAEDGELGGSLAWKSSIDGAIGTGAGFSTSALAVGQHTITATVTDSGGLSGVGSITITVLPAGGLSLSVAGYKVRGVQHADLAWSGATTSKRDDRPQWGRHRDRSEFPSLRRRLHRQHRQQRQWHLHVPGLRRRGWRLVLECRDRHVLTLESVARDGHAKHRGGRSQRSGHSRRHAGVRRNTGSVPKPDRLSRAEPQPRRIPGCVPDRLAGPGGCGAGSRSRGGERQCACCSMSSCRGSSVRT